MKKNHIFIIFVGLFIIGFAFYWYEYRPSKIKKQCYAEAEFDWKTLTAKSDTEKQSFTKNYYDNCLMRFGLK